MFKIIQHLRGNETDWEDHNFVVPDGEIAVLQHTSGITRVKIGDGKRKFSELPFLGQCLIEIDGDTATLSPIGDVDYKCNVLKNLTISLPTAAEGGYSFSLTFKSGKDSTSFKINGGSIYFTGDGCADGTLYPDPKTSYTLFIWYDGSYQGVSRGVPYE